MRVFKNESFHQMKTEVINQMINDETVASQLQSVFYKSKSSPKLAAIKAYKGNSNSWKKLFVAALEDSSYDVVSAALEKLYNQFPENSNEYLDKTRNVMGMNNSVNIKWHELYASNHGDVNESQKRLVYYASNSWEFRTRINAFNALKSIGYCNSQLVEYLFEAMLSTNGRLAAPAGQFVEYFAQQTAHKKYFVNYYKSQKWSEKEKEQLKKHMNFL